MTVMVQFRERRHNYEAGVNWRVDRDTGRLEVINREGGIVATYNTGVWDLVTTLPQVRAPRSTVPNSPEQAWNASLKPTIDVDFREGK